MVMGKQSRQWAAAAVFAGLSFALAACNQADEGKKAPDGPAAEWPTTRAAAETLPAQPRIAEELVARASTPGAATLLAPAAGEPGPTFVRVSPPLRTSLYPPTNANALAITFELEADAWNFRRQYNPDGVVATVQVVGGASASAPQSVTIDPNQAPAADASATLQVSIPADAERVDVTIDPRDNNALDNVSITALAYQ